MELFIWFIVSLVIQAVLAPKPEEPSPASLEDFQVPTADPTRPLPVIFGTVSVTGPNVVWYGDLEAEPIEKDGGLFRSDVTVGYKYYLGAHLGLSYPVDEVQWIKIDKRFAWTGAASGGEVKLGSLVDVSGFWAAALLDARPDKSDVRGKVDILMGEATQAVNPYLASVLTAPIPAFRGALSVVFKKVYWGDSPYIKSPSFLLKRTDILTTFEPQWYPTKANIAGDLNPAHIIRECLTNYEWGMGYPTTQIDDASFTAAADTLHTEGFGLSMQWVNSESVGGFIDTVKEHIGAEMDTDPSTGLYTLTLIRDDYVVGNLLLLDDSNSKLKSFERRGWGETVNEITLTYTDVVTDRKIPITEQDIGNVQIQGAVVAETVNRLGITKSDLAVKSAKSILKTRAAPISSIDLTDVSRVAYSLKRGDVFRYSNGINDLVESVYRVTDITRGELTDGGISITAVEDVFSLTSTSNVGSQVSEWVSPNTLPADVTHRKLVESSYWDVQKALTGDQIATFTSGFGFILTHAVRDASDWYGYTIQSKKGAGLYEEKGNGLFCPSAELDGDALVDGTLLTNRTISIKNGVDLNYVKTSTFAYIDGECVSILAVDVDLLTITIDHGVLDTVPADHVDGSRVWFADSKQGIDTTEWATSDTVDVKLLPMTSLGSLDVLDATSEQLTLQNRYERPYPPGNFKLEGVSYPTASIEGDLLISWSHRDRTQQLDFLHTQIEADIGPEVDTTYTIRIYDVSGAPVLKHTETGITGTQWRYYQVTRIAEFGTSGPHSVGIEVEADILGLSSRVPQSWDVTAADDAGYSNDPLWANVLILAHFEGTPGSTPTVFDNEHPAVTLAKNQGSPLISNTQFKYGATSCWFNGGASIYNSQDDSDRMGTEDFCIDGWFWPEFTGDRGICYEQGLDQANGMTLYVSQDKLTFRASGTNSLSYTGTVSPGDHVAFVRNGTNRRIYLNGTSVASDTLTFDASYAGTPVRYGSSVLANLSFRYQGHIDALRVTKGVPRYTANFTPPLLSEY